jgi:thiol:disulfide interchange protein
MTRAQLQTSMKTPFRLTPVALGFCVALPALVSPAQAAPKAAPKAKTASVAWARDYKTALAQAKRLKKPLFIDFSTDWCVGCKILDKNTFRDPKFVATSRQWVMVRVNPEKSVANAKLEKMYQVPGYPTLIFADSNGKTINQVSGSYPTEMLLPKMNAALRQLKAERLASAR